MPQHNSRQPKPGTSGSARHKGPKTDRNDRGNGPGGNSGGPPREVLISKKLSYVLRHGAEKEGLKVDERGFVNCAELLSWRVLKSMKVTFPELQEIVQTNSKQRYELTPTPTLPISSTGPATTLPAPEEVSVFSPLPQPTSIDPLASSTASLTLNPHDSVPPEPDTADPSNYLIRATQGHSLKIASSSLLTPILLPSIPDQCPRFVVHGTTRGAWAKILTSGGLSRMGRTHVHFTTSSLLTPTPSVEGEDKDGKELGVGSEKAVSGFRNTSTILVWVDVQRSLESSATKPLLWWKSANGVILTEGNERGFVGLEWVDRVEERDPSDPDPVGGRKVIWRPAGSE